MSGGSYDYLYAKDADRLAWAHGDLARMRDRLHDGVVRERMR